MSSLLIVTDDTTRSELAEALTHLNHAARREFPVVGNDAHPTPWDRAHRRMDGPLDDYLAAKA